MRNSQNLAELIEVLSKEKGISVSLLLQELEMNKNALFTMKKGGYLPRVESLCKFADYFQCSLDYLLGRTDNPNCCTGDSITIGDINGNQNTAIGKSGSPQPETNGMEAEMLQQFHSLSYPDKLKIMTEIAKLAEKIN